MSTAFRIVMEGGQEVPANGSTASGLGTFIFDSAAVAATYSVRVDGLDFGPATGGSPQTATTLDDVISMHVHNAARGANGAVVFGQINPAQDNDDRAIVLNTDGSWTVSGRWETTDPASSSINNFAAALGAAAVGADFPLYYNLHTNGFGGGEIRGQLVAIADDNANVVNGTAGHDLLPGLGGNDVVQGLAGNDTLEGGTGNDTLNGGSEIDAASYTSAASGVKVSLLLAGAQNTLGAGNDTLSNIENLTGSAFADTLTGKAGANVLDGEAGNDLLEGGAGSDTLIGDSGTDTATYASAASAVKVSLLLAGLQNTLGGGKDTLSGIENLTGSAFADTLTGDGGVNLLMGGSGDDTLQGNGSGDTLNGGTGLDTASYASAGAGVTAALAAPGTNTGDAAGDTYLSVENLTGSQFADVLTGTGGANTLNGGKGADQINGGAGIDRLLGGGGLDTLTGGGGIDTFVFNQALVAGNVATVADFAAGSETFELSLAIFAAAGPAGTLAAGAFNTGAAATQADDRIIYNSATGALLYDADGVGGVAGKTFAMVGTGLPITANNFELV